MVQTRNQDSGSHFSWHYEKQSRGDSWQANNLCDRQNATRRKNREAKVGRWGQQNNREQKLELVVYLTSARGASCSHQSTARFQKGFKG